MRKLELNVEDLTVVSFTTGPAGGAGTVRAHVDGDESALLGSCVISCQLGCLIGTLGAGCGGGTAGGNTCAYNCTGASGCGQHSCGGGTCALSCQEFHTCSGIDGPVTCCINTGAPMPPSVWC